MLIWYRKNCFPKAAKSTVLTGSQVILKTLHEHYRNLCVVRKNMVDDDKNAPIAGELAEFVSSQDKP